MVVLPKSEFVIPHVIEDVSKVEEGQEFNVEEEHFGIPWRLWAYRKDDQLQIYLCCNKCDNSPWSIDTRLEFQLISSKGESINTFTKRTFSSARPPYESNVWGWNEFISWKNLMKYFAVDGKATIEVRVVIEKMEGCGKTEKLRNFDESAREFSDVVLVVENRKFYLSKLFLGFQSSYFRGLLLGNFEESKKEEVILNDIDPDDFQKFLEVLHGEPALNDRTVDGILFLTDMFDAPTALRRCEEFLMEKSKRSLKGKLELASGYNLENLKEQCLSDSKPSPKFAWLFHWISPQLIGWYIVGMFFAWLLPCYLYLY